MLDSLLLLLRRLITQGIGQKVQALSGYGAQGPSVIVGPTGPFVR